MKKERNNLVNNIKVNKGLTIIALVITVIVLIILSGSTIAVLTDENGIINKAKEIAEKQKISENKEKIDLKLLKKMEMSTRKTSITLDEVEELFENEDYVKSINISEEDPSKLIITTKDNFLFEILVSKNGTLSSQFQGKDDEEPKPEINLEMGTTSNTNDNVTIKITVIDDNKGIEEIVMPDSTIKTYSGEKIVTDTYTATENGKYTFKVTGKNGKVTRKIVNINNIIPLGEIAKDSNEVTITNDSVLVTLTYSEDVYGKNEKLTNLDRYQYKIGEEGSWQVASQVQQVVVSENTTIYARYFNGVESLKMSTIKISSIDKVSPVEFNLNTINTTNSITISGSTTDLGSEGINDANIGVRGYQFQLKDINENIIIDWTEEQTDTSYTFNELTQNIEYKVNMRAIDKAGNIREATNKGEIVKTGAVTSGVGNVIVSMAPTVSTNEMATIKLTTITGLKIQYQKDSINEDGWINYNQGTMGFSINENGIIYVRLIDEIGQGGNSISLNIVNIDKVPPVEFDLNTTNTTNGIRVSGSTTDLGSVGTSAVNIGVRGYQFQLKDKNGNIIIDWTEEQTNSSYIFNNLSANMEYKVSMRAIDKAGNIREARNKETSVIVGAVEIENPTEETETQFTKAYGVIEIAWLDTDNNVIEEPLLITSTELGGLIPVKWSEMEGGKESTTTVNDNLWYNYQEQTANTDGKTSIWANAKTNNNNAYFVWIPRYAYKIIYFDNEVSKANYKTGSGSYKIVGYGTKYGMINVSSETEKLVTATQPANISGTVKTKGYTDYIPHPAFEFDGAKKGIWVGKYESSGSTSTVKIIPNASSLRSKTVSNIITAAQGVKNKYKLTGDSHLIKNIEWGAVAYLAESKYGRNGTEITKNNSSSYYTGRAATSLTDNSTSSAGKYKYNTEGGVLASTTGNIYGIYDMSGGAKEYVSGYLNNENINLLLYNLNLLNANIKYKDVYNIGKSDISVNNYVKNNNIYGDAIYEISSEGVGSTGWNSDYSNYIYGSYPIFVRGGYCKDNNSTGTFNFGNSNGSSNSSISFRVCLMP